MGDRASLSGLALPVEPTVNAEAAPKSYVDRLTSPVTPDPTWHGLNGWAFDPIAAGGSTAVAAGIIQLSRVYLRAGQVVTNLHVFVTAAGSGLTAGANFLALYSLAGTRLGVTADQASSWATAAGKIVPLTSAYTVTTSGFYYVALLANGTTAPSLSRTTTAATGINFAGAASTSRFATGGTGQTSMPATITVAAPAASAPGYWLATS